MYNNITMKNFDSIEKSRKASLALLERYEYGKMPPRPLHLNVETLSEDRAYAAGKATLTEVNLKLVLDGGKEFILPVRYAIPNGVTRPPVILHISYDGSMPNKHQPTEELCDRGFAVFTLAYEDLTKNDGNFKSLAAPYLLRGRRGLDSPGKLIMWAWGARCVMDYVKSIDDKVDAGCVAVVGHGILGTSALLAGAFDERFAFVISSSSGFGGAASVSAHTAPLLELKSRAPYLFSKRYIKYSGRESTLPFDQSLLLSLVAPRALLISTADDAYTEAHIQEELSVKEANLLVREMKNGKIGIESAHPCEICDKNSSWKASYRLREGFPYLSREDWAYFIDYINEAIGKIKK